MVTRVFVLCLLSTLGVVSSALASDQTAASAAITTLAGSAGAWGFAIAGLAFVTAIAAKLLEHFYDVRSLSGSAVNVLIGVGLMSSVVGIIATAGSAAGADLTEAVQAIDVVMELF